MQNEVEFAARPKLLSLALQGGWGTQGRQGGSGLFVFKHFMWFIRCGTEHCLFSVFVD